MDYRLKKSLWCFTENCIAVRFEYESRDTEGQWWRSRPYHRFAPRLRGVASTGYEPEAVLALAEWLEARVLLAGVHAGTQLFGKYVLKSSGTQVASDFAQWHHSAGLLPEGV